MRLSKLTLGLASITLMGLAAQAGSVTGVVDYEGAVPKLPTVKMNADPGCAAKHKTPVKNEMLVLGDGNTMGNIYVSITKGLPSKTWPTPGTPATLNQDGCKYSPHVLAVMQGQELKILNSDGLLHNVHALPKLNKEFNMAMPASRKEATKTFDKVEKPFKIKCDVHPWMGAFIVVTDHPFFDVTGTDGKFEIKDLPAGTYDVTIWQEKLGTKTQSVTVPASGSVTQNFTLSRPGK